MNPNVLHRWRREFHRGPGNAFPGWGRRRGRRDEAMCLLRELEQLLAQGRASPIAFVVFYAGLGDTDAALEWLDTACRLRCDIQYLTAGFPGIDPLRSDPRFADLIRRIGIVPSQQ